MRDAISEPFRRAWVDFQFRGRLPHAEELAKEVLRAIRFIAKAQIATYPAAREDDDEHQRLVATRRLIEHALEGDAAARFELGCRIRERRDGVFYRDARHGRQ